MVTPGDKRKNPSLEEVKDNCARFASQPAVFGKTGQMFVERVPFSKNKKYGGFWLIKIRVEGSRFAAHVKEDVNYVAEMFAKYFAIGFGTGTHTDCVAKHEAGDTGDGKPADQLLIIPPVKLWPVVSDRHIH